jgi:hypothetical protein
MIMSKYEYQTITLLGYEIDKDLLDEYGENGWELTGFQIISSRFDHIPEPTWYLIFKRRKE